MIMALAVLAGSIAGLIRAGIRKRPYQPVSLRHLWLIFTATVPQFAAFYIPGVRSAISNPLASFILISSQVLLLVFSLLNAKRVGIRIAGVGLGLNLAAIFANKGFMPISQDTARKLWPQASEEDLKPGKRLGWTKDVILPKEKTHFSWLSDRFIVSFFNNRYAFSFGDLVIALGVFLLLWASGGSKKS